MLLRELEVACEPAFAAMSKVQWGTLEAVSGESPYIGDLVKAVDAVLEVVRSNIEQKKYLRNLYDKAARCGTKLDALKMTLIALQSLVITRFTNALVKSRPLKEVGAQQVHNRRIFKRHQFDINPHR